MEQPSGNFNLKKRFKLKTQPDLNSVKANLNGFEYPKMQIITVNNPNEITTDYNWGLIPNWAKTNEIRKFTLNARAETILEKPAFKNVVTNRCLILATCFYEWHWLDEKGKIKQKYQITSAENEVFCMAGIFSQWINPTTLITEKTVAMVTTQANETMQFVHNHKKRMPIILNKNMEQNWLNPNFEIPEFEFPKYNPNIIAFPVLEQAV